MEFLSRLVPRLECRAGQRPLVGKPSGEQRKYLLSPSGPPPLPPTQASPPPSLHSQGTWGHWAPRTGPAAPQTLGEEESLLKTWPEGGAPTASTVRCQPVRCQPGVSPSTPLASLEASEHPCFSQEGQRQACSPPVAPSRHPQVVRRTHPCCAGAGCGAGSGPPLPQCQTRSEQWPGSSPRAQPPGATWTARSGG